MMVGLLQDFPFSGLADGFLNCIAPVLWDASWQGSGYAGQKEFFARRDAKESSSIYGGLNMQKHWI
jgi:hypothetical protein